MGLVPLSFRNLFLIIMSLVTETQLLVEEFSFLTLLGEPKKSLLNLFLFDFVAHRSDISCSILQDLSLFYLLQFCLIPILLFFRPPVLISFLILSLQVLADKLSLTILLYYLHFLPIQSFSSYFA